MREILELAAKVGGLGGLAIAFVFFIFRQTVAKDVFPKLTKRYGAAVLMAIIDKMYKLALAALLFGLLALLISKVVPRPNPPRIEPSVTVSLPDNITLKSAVLLLVENDHSTAKFKPGCSDSFLKAKVRGGTIRARDTADLIKQINYRLIGAKAGLSIYAKKDEEGGIYAIDCIQ